MPLAEPADSFSYKDVAARPAAPEEYYVFASFRLFPGQRKLLQGDGPVPIRGRAFDLLLLLVSQAGIVVSSGDLMRFLWPKITVEEANLRVQVSTLRKTLSQCEETQRAIETVPLRGYCFTLPVRHHPKGAEPAPPKLPVPRALPALLNRSFHFA